jgi:hypothetical protein
MSEHRTRRVESRGTVSYQHGHYEMVGAPGRRRSAFKVDVHLGAYPTPEEAMAAWTDDVERLRRAGRERQAEKLAGKLERLRRLS